MTPRAADTLSPGTHTLSVHGIAACYHVYGRGPVCLVHPGGPGVFWDPMRMPAVEEQMTVVYAEPLGTGASGRLASHPHGYTRHLYADVLDRLIHHLQQDKVYLLGHSHGGFVAQRYALDHADRLTGLILYEGAPVTGEEHGAEAAQQAQAPPGTRTTQNCRFSQRCSRLVALPTMTSSPQPCADFCPPT